MRISKMRNYNPQNNTRNCKNCKKDLGLINFSTRIKKLKSGELVINYREICKDCSKGKLIALGVPSLEHRRNKRRQNPLRILLNAARARAKKQNIDFNITKDDLFIPEKCPYLDIPIIIGDGIAHMNSPSIDRIDNSKGYIKGNVMIISYKANTCKNSLSLEELRLFSNNIQRVLNKLGEFSEQPEVVNTEPSTNLNG